MIVPRNVEYALKEGVTVTFCGAVICMTIVREKSAVIVHVTSEFYAIEVYVEIGIIVDNVKIQLDVTSAVLFELMNAS